MTVTKRQFILFVFRDNDKTVFCFLSIGTGTSTKKPQTFNTTQTKTNKAHPHRISTNAEAKTWAKEFSEKCTTKGMKLPDDIVKVVTAIKENGLKIH